MCVCCSDASSCTLKALLTDIVHIKIIIQEFIKIHSACSLLYQCKQLDSVQSNSPSAEQSVSSTLANVS